MELVLGIDLGTSYFKLGLFDRRGELCGLGRVALHPRTDGGVCELPVEQFRDALRDGLAQAFAQAGAGPAAVRAVGYSSQASSFVLLDAVAALLTPLVLWPDARAKGLCPDLAALWDRADFMAVTGLGITPNEQFTAAKLRWFQKNQPATWRQVRRVMTISDYLVFCLTGRAVGDAGTAALLGLLDLRGLRWWPEALELIGLDEAKLSRPLAPGTVAGTISSDGAEILGIPRGVPLAVGSLDHHVAAIGAGLGRVADVSESTGTVLACLRYEDRFEPCRGTCMGPGLHEGQYYRLAFGDNGAKALEWYQRTYASHLTVAELVAQAATVPPDCDGLAALASADSHAAGERADLSGFQNVKPAHTPGHFARAIMQSTAESLRALVDRLCPGIAPGRIVATGGGARSDLWLQIKADLLGVEFVRTRCDEPACLGAALLAAAACKWFGDVEQAANAWIVVEQVFAPSCRAG